MGIVPRALEFVILTAARTSEVLGAQCAELDRDEALWTRAGRAHEGCARAPGAAIRKRASHPRADGRHSHLPTSYSPARNVGAHSRAWCCSCCCETWARGHHRARLPVELPRLGGRDDKFSREVAEAALAHAVSDKVEAAYRRSDLFEKRRDLMEAWARHCDTGRAQGARRAQSASHENGVSRRPNKRLDHVPGRQCEDSARGKPCKAYGELTQLALPARRRRSHGR